VVDVGSPDPPASLAPFDGCDYDPTPLLFITRDEARLDGMLVDLAKLEDFLKQKRELDRLIGARPKHEILVQVAAGVSEARVARFLVTARASGFFDVTRLSLAAPMQAKVGRPRNLPETPLSKPP